MIRKLIAKALAYRISILLWDILLGTLMILLNMNNIYAFIVIDNISKIILYVIFDIVWGGKGG